MFRPTLHLPGYLSFPASLQIWVSPRLNVLDVLLAVPALLKLAVVLGSALSPPLLFPTSLSPPSS